LVLAFLRVTQVRVCFDERLMCFFNHVESITRKHSKLNAILLIF
jgi:hypothetical protein